MSDREEKYKRLVFGTPDLLGGESADQLAEKAAALAAELRVALDDPKRYEWGNSPWEHLGDAERDVRMLLDGYDALLARLAEAERLQVRAEDRSHDQFMARKAAEAERERLKAELEQARLDVLFAWNRLPDKVFKFPGAQGVRDARARLARCAERIRTRAVLAADEEGEHGSA